mgnify:CR=1 FL=1
MAATLKYIQPDAEAFMIHLARVSSDNENNPDYERLLNKCMRDQHWSVFEMADVVMELYTSRAIAAQILRHRSFHFQEFSQRYADPTQELDFVLREARLQDTKNRQNSIETDNLALQSFWETRQKKVIEECKSAYDWAIANGIAKEQARAVLPEGITVSRLYMNGTLRSWVHYIQLRSEKGTQKEHRDVALACALVIEPVFPMIKEYINEQ